MKNLPARKVGLSFRTKYYQSADGIRSNSPRSCVELLELGIQSSCNVREIILHRIVKNDGTYFSRMGSIICAQ